MRQEPDKASPPKRRGHTPMQYQLADIKKWLYRHQEGEVLDIPFYSAAEANEETDFALMTEEGDAELAHWIARLAKKLAHVKSRKKRRHRRKGVLNLRALVRTRFIKGDELLDLSYLQRQKQRSKLLLICDVSKSMQLYGHFLHRFMHEVQGAFAFCQTFVFNTRIHPLPYQKMTWVDTLQQLEQVPGLWSGGTRIGASLNELYHHHLPSWFDRQTRVIICSDGWDTGDLDLLSETMYQLRRHCRDIIWLNPVVRNLDDVQIAGVKEALRYTDVMAPVYNLRTLKDFVQTIAIP